MEVISGICLLILIGAVDRPSKELELDLKENIEINSDYHLASKISYEKFKEIGLIRVDLQNRKLEIDYLPHEDFLPFFLQELKEITIDEIRIEKGIQQNGRQYYANEVKMIYRSVTSGEVLPASCFKKMKSRSGRYNGEFHCIPYTKSRMGEENKWTVSL